MTFLEQALEQATHVVFGGYLVTAGTVLVTPGPE